MKCEILTNYLKVRYVQKNFLFYHFCFDVLEGIFASLNSVLWSSFSSIGLTIYWFKNRCLQRSFIIFYIILDINIFYFFYNQRPLIIFYIILAINIFYSILCYFYLFYQVRVWSSPVAVAFRTALAVAVHIAPAVAVHISLAVAVRTALAVGIRTALAVGIRTALAVAVASCSRGRFGVGRRTPAICVLYDFYFRKKKLRCNFSNIIISNIIFIYGHIFAVTLIQSCALTCNYCKIILQPINLLSSSLKYFNTVYFSCIVGCMPGVWSSYVFIRTLLFFSI